ncbi:hypothetical protein C5167_006121 [Papaver somniferum]|uniref:Uncharacterized protein n=1 Tax=Papaver somniferum TaxID=3469 RepID=A0A4Y7JFM7_PAPSO|nr:hypothetical protein C5167_006121 [Papaver somniferum]
MHELLFEKVNVETSSNCDSPIDIIRWQSEYINNVASRILSTFNQNPNTSVVQIEGEHKGRSIMMLEVEHPDAKGEVWSLSYAGKQFLRFYNGELEVSIQ